MKPLFIVALASLLIAIPRHASATQPEGTPIISSVNGCTIAPLTQDRIDELAAMADASPVAESPPQATTLPGGTPISVEVQDQLLDTLAQIDACSRANDLPRLLSLYSERFIVTQFFAPETVPIISAPDRTPVSATPAAEPTDQRPMILAAVQLPDGRIAAQVSANGWRGNQQIVWFVEQDGRWVVDRTAPAADSATGGATDVEIPMEAQSVVDLVRQDAATQLDVDPSALDVTAIQAVDWPDSSLGCPEDGGVYAQVISPGYQITIGDGTASIEYHTGPDDLFVLCTS